MIEDSIDLPLEAVEPAVNDVESRVNAPAHYLTESESAGSWPMGGRNPRPSQD